MTEEEALDLLAAWIKSVPDEELYDARKKVTRTFARELKKRGMPIRPEGAGAPRGRPANDDDQDG